MSEKESGADAAGERLVLTLYYPLKRMGLTDVSAWGLDAGNVSTESINYRGHPGITRSALDME